MRSEKRILLDIQALNIIAEKYSIRNNALKMQLSGLRRKQLKASEKSVSMVTEQNMILSRINLTMSKNAFNASDLDDANVLLTLKVDCIHELEIEQTERKAEIEAIYKKLAELRAQTTEIKKMIGKLKGRRDMAAANKQLQDIVDIRSSISAFEKIGA